MNIVFASNGNVLADGRFTCLYIVERRIGMLSLLDYSGLTGHTVVLDVVAAGKAATLTTIHLFLGTHPNAYQYIPSYKPDVIGIEASLYESNYVDFDSIITTLLPSAQSIGYKVYKSRL